MNKEQIEARIEQLILERSNLEGFHADLVQVNQKTNQEFQQKVVQNQTKFAQLTGAILELQQLVKPSTQKDNNHDDSIPTLDFGNRPPDVRLSEQPEGR